MPVSRAPYKREYKHSIARGRETMIRCEFCGRLVPRYKTFVMRKGLSLGWDELLRKEIHPEFLHLGARKVRMCPACARFRGISVPGKSRRR